MSGDDSTSSTSSASEIEMRPTRPLSADPVRLRGVEASTGGVGGKKRKRSRLDAAASASVLSSVVPTEDSSRRTGNIKSAETARDSKTTLHILPATVNMPYVCSHLVIHIFSLTPHGVVFLNDVDLRPYYQRLNAVQGESGPSQVDIVGQGREISMQQAINPSSLQALVSAHRQGGDHMLGPLASQRERAAIGGTNHLLDNFIANDLQAAIRANEVANQGILHSAIGQLSQSGSTGAGVQPQSLASVAAVAVASDHRIALAAALAQRSLALSTVPFIGTHRDAFADGALSQLLSQQLSQNLPGQFPPNLTHGLFLGHPSQWTAQLPSHNISPWAGLPAGLGTDLLLARQHGPTPGGVAAGLFPTSETQTYGQRDQDGVPLDLPVILALPEDHLKLSSHQVLLRHQIEAFRATDEDVSTHTRGRNKPVELNQIGIRCRHCAHLPVGKRQKGSTYFPAALLGLYQAAQNMSTTHMQCGLCSEMPTEIKQQFAHLISTKVASGAGRPHWARAAKKLGLVDTEDGIRFIRDLDSESKRKLLGSGGGGGGGGSVTGEAAEGNM